MRMRERDFESVKYASVQDAKDAHSSRMVKIIEHTGDPSTFLCICRCSCRWLSPKHFHRYRSKAYFCCEVIPGKSIARLYEKVTAQRKYCMKIVLHLGRNLTPIELKSKKGCFSLFQGRLMFADFNMIRTIRSSDSDVNHACPLGCKLRR